MGSREQVKLTSEFFREKQSEVMWKVIDRGGEFTLNTGGSGFLSMLIPKDIVDSDDFKDGNTVEVSGCFYTVSELNIIRVLGEQGIDYYHLVRKER